MFIPEISCFPFNPNYWEESARRVNGNNIHVLIKIICIPILFLVCVFTYLQTIFWYYSLKEMWKEPYQECLVKRYPLYLNRYDDNEIYNYDIFINLMKFMLFVYGFSIFLKFYKFLYIWYFSSANTNYILLAMYQSFQLHIIGSFLIGIIYLFNFIHILVSVDNLNKNYDCNNADPCQEIDYMDDGKCGESYTKSAESMISEYTSIDGPFYVVIFLFSLSSIFHVYEKKFIYNIICPAFLFIFTYYTIIIPYMYYVAIGLGLINCLHILIKIVRNTNSNNTNTSEMRPLFFLTNFPISGRMRVSSSRVQPISKNYLKRNKCKIYKYSSDMEGNKECPISLNEFKPREKVIEITYCKHRFSYEALDRWLDENTTCPSCRHNLLG